MAEGSPLVRITLKDAVGDNEVQIYVGWPEAIAIQSQLEGQKPERPFTHDLMASIFSILKVKVIQLLISDMKEAHYYGTLTLSLEGQVHEIDCRPSDGIALAIRSAAPIYIHEDLMQRIKEAEEAQEMHPTVPGSMVVEREDTTIH